MAEFDSENLAELRHQLITSFNLDEIKTLCFDIGVDYEEIAGSDATKSGLARSLIAYLLRRDKLPDLIAIVRLNRPDVIWGDFQPPKPPQPEQATQSAPKYLRVFLCHGSPDKSVVRNLYHKLKADGFEPWMDIEDLIGGQDWQLELTKALRKCDVILVCASQESVSKSGYMQKEIRFAVDRALD